MKARRIFYKTPDSSFRLPPQKLSAQLVPVHTTCVRRFFNFPFFVSLDDVLCLFKWERAVVVVLVALFPY